MNPPDLFCRSYKDARRRFREAAITAGETLEQDRVATSEDHANFTIDVPTLGSANPGWAILVSSGIHGVEGFFGSAI